MISKKEIDAILKLEPLDRFKYFIKRVVDFEEVWLLFNENDGYALNIEDDNSKYLPVWPFKEFSETWRSGSFSKFNSVKVNIHIFKDEMLPKLSKNKINILVFPTETKKGFIITIKEFENILNDEMTQYE